MTQPLVSIPAEQEPRWGITGMLPVGSIIATDSGRMYRIVDHEDGQVVAKPYGLDAERGVDSVTMRPDILVDVVETEPH